MSNTNLILQFCYPLNSINRNVLTGNDLLRYEFLCEHYADSVGLWTFDSYEKLCRQVNDKKAMDEMYYGLRELRGIYYVVPLYSYLGNLYGVYFRNILANSSVTRHYIHSEYSNFTLYLYSAWKNFNSITAITPIILCEGVLDNLYVQTVYPYVISFCGVGFNEERIYILSKLSNRFILFFDNDNGGKLAKNRFLQSTKDYNFLISSFDYPSNVSDPFDCLYKGVDLRLLLGRYL